MSALFSPSRWYFLIAAIIIVFVQILYQNYRFGDELHYLGVGFEMWNQQHFLLPLSDGHLDLQKPPLFYWIMHLTWLLFGVNNITPQVMPWLFSFINILLTSLIAESAFPKTKHIGLLSALMLSATYFWFDFSSHLRFDGLMLLFILLSWYSIFEFESHHKKFFLLLSFAIAGGLMTKGPLFLLFILPAFFVYHSRNTNTHYSLILIAGSLGTSLALSWLFIVWFYYGSDVVHYLILDQASSRILHFQTELHWGKYLSRLPGNLLPWLIWPPLWIAINRDWRSSPKPLTRLFLYTALAIFLFFTFIVTRKVSRYLLPMYPFLFIYFASIILIRLPKNTRALYLWPSLMLCFIMSILFMNRSDFALITLFYSSALLLGMIYCWRFPVTRIITQAVIIAITTISTYLFMLISPPHYDIANHQFTVFCQDIKKITDKHIPVFIRGEGDDWQNYEFLGRLQPFVPTVAPAKLTALLKNTPQAFVVTATTKPLTCAKPTTQFRIDKHHWVALWEAKKSQACF